MKRSDPTPTSLPAVPAFFRLTKAQHEKALEAAQGVTVGGPVYTNLANKVAGYQVGHDIDFDEKEVAMLKDWGVSVRDAE